MKKILLFTTALLTATGTVTTFAHFTVSLGVQSVQMDVESHADRSIIIAVPGPKTPPPFFINDSEDNQDTDIGGELALGYQYDFNSTVNIAFEIFGQLLATQVKTPVYANYTDLYTSEAKAPVYDATASFDWIAGLRLRPGYYVTPSTRLFVDGGVVLGGFELEQADVVVEYWNAQLGADFDETENETLMGWRYGAGVEHEFTDNFAMGIDFIVTEFEKFESDHVEDVAEITTDLSGGLISAFAQSTYRPTLTTIGLNFKYLFGASTKQAQRPPQKFYPMDK